MNVFVFLHLLNLPAFNTPLLGFNKYISIYSLVYSLAFSLLNGQRGGDLVDDAGFPADALCVKAITVAVATSEPELGAGVGLGFVIPFHHVRAARPGVERLQAGVVCKQKCCICSLIFIKFQVRSNHVYVSALSIYKRVLVSSVHNIMSWTYCVNYS